jgi:hypothetical protein
LFHEAGGFYNFWKNRWHWDDGSNGLLAPHSVRQALRATQDYFRSHPAAAVLATWCHGLELRPSMWAGEPRGYRTRGKLAVGGGRSGIVIGLFKRGTWKVGIMGIISWDHPEEAEFFLAISGELFRVTCFNQLLILVILTLISEISTGIQCLPILWLCGFEPKRCC